MWRVSLQQSTLDRDETVYIYMEYFNNSTHQLGHIKSMDTYDALSTTVNTHKLQYSQDLCNKECSLCIAIHLTQHAVSDYKDYKDYKDGAVHGMSMRDCLFITTLMPQC